MEYDFASLITPVIALVVAGAFAGFVSGLLGVGGGIVTVPVMFELFHVLKINPDIGMHVAVATSLATIIPTSIMSGRAHHKRGAVDFDLMKRMAPAAFVGVIIAAIAGGIFKGVVLSAIFGTVAVIVALYMFFRRDSWRVAQDYPRGVAGAGVSGGIGFISALMGIGGGTLGVPIMSLCNVPVHRAVGTASALGLVIGIPGAIGYIITGWGHPDLPPFSLGYVNLLAAALMLPTILAVVPYGAKVAHSISKVALQRAFGVFLLITGSRMLSTLFH